MPDLLLLNAVFYNNKLTDEGVFTVVINGAQQAVTVLKPGQSSVQLPDTPRPLPLEISLASTPKHHFPTSGSFEYQGRGNLVVKSAPPEFQQPRAVFASPVPGVTQNSSFTVTLTAYLSRVRDVTPRVLTELGSVPNSKVNPRTAPNKAFHTWPPTTWHPPSLPGFLYVVSPLLSGGTITTSAQTLEPATTDLVLEVAHVDAPQYISIHWPTAIQPDASVKPTPFLLYIHPSMGQNLPDYKHQEPPYVGAYEGIGQKPYPLGWDYLYYGMWRYLNYDSDPFNSDAYAKGLPYQMAASGKQAVLVLPLNRAGKEAGVMLNAPIAEELLGEISGFMHRKAALYGTPSLGRVAAASFSAGVALLERLLDSTTTESGHLNQLVEAYAFDRGFGSPSVKAITQSVKTMTTWVAKDPARMVRYYAQSGPGEIGNYKSLVGTTPAGGASLTQSADGKRTLLILPQSAWKPYHGGRWSSGQDLHQLISATMLTDALRRSGF